MIVLRWLAGYFSKQRQSSSHYKRGVARARKQDHKGAILEYNKSIAIPETTSEMRAMALYNRAVAHSAVGDGKKAMDDLHTVLSMDQPPVNVRTMARQRLSRIEARARRAP